nr:MAG TPA: hypothetical protein [Caudoviricetes sp.]
MRFMSFFRRLRHFFVFIIITFKKHEFLRLFIQNELANLFLRKLAEAESLL